MLLSPTLKNKVENFIPDPSLEIKTNRYKKFENYLNEHDFDKLMLRLVFEHNDDYINNCYNKGYSPIPNNKLQFILDYVSDNYADIIVKVLKLQGNNTVWSFKGYFFQLNFDTNTINVFNKDDLKLMIKL